MTDVEPYDYEPPHPSDDPDPDDLDAIQEQIRLATTRTADITVSAESVGIRVPVALGKAAEILHERVGPERINQLDDLAVHDTIVRYILDRLEEPLERDLDPYMRRVEQIVRRRAEQ